MSFKKIQFPRNKKFAFTIFDDTDNAKVENIRAVYDLLFELGIFTTKSVWVVPTRDIQNEFYKSFTLEKTAYLDFIKKLHANGFEIALHGASMASSTRDVIAFAIERFKKLLGFYPRVHANHMFNKENLYWGQARFDNVLLKCLLSFVKGNVANSEGHSPDSPYFWGDICKRHISYVRNFVFREINLLRINPTLPYKDPKRPYVNYWFSSSEGGHVRSFNELLSSKNQERLEQEGGVCIVYTHFANHFVENGKVNSRTKELLTELSKRQGWFIPVSELLDYLKAKQLNPIRPLSERLKMEFKWLLTKSLHGSS